MNEESTKRGGGALSVRQGRVLRRVLREAVASSETYARALDPLRRQSDASLWRRAMKNAADYRRLLKVLAPSRWNKGQGNGKGHSNSQA